MELRPLVDEGDGSRDRPALTNTIALLAAALKEEAGIEDGRLRGVYEDEADGHGTYPWRSGIRRAGFEVKNLRHASRAEASLRILEEYQRHPAYVASDRFELAAGKRVNAEQLARLVEAARADAEMCLTPADAGRCRATGSLGSWTPLSGWVSGWVSGWADGGPAPTWCPPTPRTRVSSGAPRRWPT